MFEEPGEITRDQALEAFERLVNLAAGARRARALESGVTVEVYIRRVSSLLVKIRQAQIDAYGAEADAMEFVKAIDSFIPRVLIV